MPHRRARNEWVISLRNVFESQNWHLTAKERANCVNNDVSPMPHRFDICNTCEQHWIYAIAFLGCIQRTTLGELNAKYGLQCRTCCSINVSFSIRSLPRSVPLCNFVGEKKAKLRFLWQEIRNHIQSLRPHSKRFFSHKSNWIELQSKQVCLNHKSLANCGWETNANEFPLKRSWRNWKDRMDKGKQNSEFRRTKVVFRWNQSGSPDKRNIFSFLTNTHLVVGVQFKENMRFQA